MHFCAQVCLMKRILTLGVTTPLAFFSRTDTSKKFMLGNWDKTTGIFVFNSDSFLVIKATSGSCFWRIHSTSFAAFIGETRWSWWNIDVSFFDSAILQRDLLLSTSARGQSGVKNNQSLRLKNNWFSLITVFKTIEIHLHWKILFLIT